MLIDPASFNSITSAILGWRSRCIGTLGPGLLESIYRQCLERELAAHHLRFVVHRPIPVIYKGTPLDARYYVDLIVEDLVVVEIKSVGALIPVYEAQTLT